MSTLLSRAPYFLFLIFFCFPALAQVSAQSCGPIGNGFGPFDYRADRDPYTAGTGDHKTKLGLVEGAHFTTEVELLIRGHRSGNDPGGDLDYTLRAFPNHHRALFSVMRYGEKKKSLKPAGLTVVVECYFERALRFKSDDAIVRMIYSTYLTKNNRQAEAITQLEQATVLAGENGFTHYNVGLIYFDMKLYDQSLARAHRAMALGFENEVLRDLLKNAKQWREPTDEPQPPK